MKRTTSLFASGLALAATRQCKDGVVCNGTGERDRLLGTTGQDQIHGKGAADRVYGYGHSDYLFGEKGNDRLFGGPSEFLTSDFLYGGPDSDQLNGGDQRDVYTFKSTGDDKITGNLLNNRITSSGGFDEVHGDLGNDSIDVGDGSGGDVVFSSDRGLGNFELYTMKADGTDQTPITESTTFNGNPAWSPDGDSIVFDRETSGNGDIWVVGANGSSPFNLTSGWSSYEQTPDWQPQ